MSVTELPGMATLSGGEPSCISTGYEGKKLGAFYTPDAVAQVLANWAVRDPTSVILDPSYGGCSFLRAACATLKRRGSSRPERQIFGIDIDPSAEDYSSELIAAGSALDQFLKKDFFETTLEDFGERPFDVILGNPPYIRYHSIPKELQERAQERLSAFGISISGRASYWAFFLLYSMQLLRAGGRLAMILPGALLHTDYAVQVRDLLIKHFERVTIYLLQERIFTGTEEESVIVCAEGAHIANKEVRIGSVATASELEDGLDNLNERTRALDSNDADGGWLRTLVNQETLDLYDHCSSSSSVIRLGQWVNSRIGVVTGNNSYFVMSKKEWELREIPKAFLSPIIKRPAYMNGLVVRDKDLEPLTNKGGNLLLLNVSRNAVKSGPLKKYLDQGEENGVHLAQKCQSRTPWYSVPHTYVPEAFIPCMAATWPRLIVNRSAYTCTNNILRLSWKGDTRPAADWMRLALGSLSSLCQLSAEFVGRSYGGGVIKVEPTELKRLVVPLVPQDSVKTLFQRVDALLRKNRVQEATSAVDSTLFNLSSKKARTELGMLQAARNKLFLRRRQHRRGATKVIT